MGICFVVSRDNDVGTDERWGPLFPVPPQGDDVERKRGKWLDISDGWKCPICHEKNDYSKRFNFCPNCGADMREKDDVW